MVWFGFRQVVFYRGQLTLDVIHGVDGLAKEVYHVEVMDHPMALWTDEGRDGVKDEVVAVTRDVFGGDA
jgi:hypothetical protein